MRVRFLHPLAARCEVRLHWVILLCAFAAPLSVLAGASEARESFAPPPLRKVADNAVAVQGPIEKLEMSRDQAMWAALAFEDAEKLSILLKQGANPNKPDELSQMTPLMAAETLAMAKVLIAAGANPNMRDRLGRTALHHAAKMREGAAIMELLVRSGGDVNARALDAALSTPLICAIENYLENKDRQQASLIIRVLAHLGADMNAPNARGNNPLVLAATSNQAELIKLLVELGADPSRPVSDGRTAMDFAKEAGASEAIQALAAAPSRTVPAN
jgi:ankyrin repeat protein